MLSEKIEIVMEGCASISYGTVHANINKFSLFRTSSSGLLFLQKNNPDQFYSALRAWCDVIKVQILQMTQYELDILKDMPGMNSSHPWLEDFFWLDSLSESDVQKCIEQER